MRVDEILLAEVKSTIRVTWNDEDEANIIPIIKGAMRRLNNIVGVKLDFDADEDVRQLLKDLCRYTYNNASEYFEDNFHSEIVRTQYRYAVKEMLEAGDDDAE